MKMKMRWISIILGICLLVVALDYYEVYPVFALDCTCYDQSTGTVTMPRCWFVTNGLAKRCSKDCEWGDDSSLFNRYFCTQDKEGVLYMPYLSYDLSVMRWVDRSSGEVVAFDLGYVNIDTKVNFYSTGDVVCDTYTNRQFICGKTTVIESGLWHDTGESCASTPPECITALDCETSIPGELGVWTCENGECVWNPGVTTTTLPGIPPPPIDSPILLISLGVLFMISLVWKR